MNVRVVIRAGVVAVMLVACGRAVETRSGGDPSVASSATTTAAPPPTSMPLHASTGPTRAPEGSTLIAYAFEEDVWLYDERSGRVERLTSDVHRRREHSLRFRDAGRLTFVSMSANKDDSTLVEVDLNRGTRRTLLAVDQAVWAYDWSGDGSTVVYVASVPGDGPDDGSFAHELRRLTPGAGSPSVLRRFDGLFGRGGFVNVDEVRVDWSPDGSTLLLVDTHLDTGRGAPNTLFVLRPDGTDLVAPRTGTWGRWADAGTVVYGDDTGGVHTLQPASGRAAPLPVTGPARRLAVSPDGRFLAYDDGAADPTVSVFDIERRTGRPVAGHAVGALWLSAGTLAAGHATPCVASEAMDCDAGGHGAPWTEVGDGWRIDVVSDRVTPLPVSSTVDAAVGRAPD